MSPKPMVPPATSGERNLPEPGTYKARCIQIIHVGTLNEKFMEHDKMINTVRFVWELLDCYDPETGDYPIFNEEKGPQPYVITQKYTYVLSEKSNLFKLIERWTKASKPSKDELLAYDISTLLGKPCNITIEHGESKSGKAFVEIVLLSSPVKPKPGQPGYDKPMNELVLFDIDDFEEETFQMLFPWVQKEISTTVEFKEQFPGRTIGDNKSNNSKSKKPVPMTDFDDEEEEDEFAKAPPKKSAPKAPAKPAPKGKPQKEIEDAEEVDGDWEF